MFRNFVGTQNGEEKKEEAKTVFLFFSLDFFVFMFRCSEAIMINGMAWYLLKSVSVAL